MDDKIKKQMAEEIKISVITGIKGHPITTDEELMQIIEKNVMERPSKMPLLAAEKAVLVKFVFEKLRGLDILQPMIEDHTISEIMVNGTENIFIERNGVIERLNFHFEDQERLEDVIRNIVSKVNRFVNESEPICDARLKDGSRVSVVMPPVALNGPILTIRKFPDKPMTVKQLIEKGAISTDASKMLENLVKAKFNMFISGGTGSGKTTFLNVLSGFIPKEERIITIEDAAELKIYGIENLVRMETRNANVEGRGEVTIRDLIKASLRMRPERIIVGEVRGGEAFDMLQAMNTGHDGSLSTGHANSCKDMLSRLETMVLCAAPLPIEAIRQQIAAAIDIIIHLGKLRDKSRKVLEISEIAGYQNGEIILNPLFIFEEGFSEDPSGEIQQSGHKNNRDTKMVKGILKRTENPLINKLKLSLSGMDV